MGGRRQLRGICAATAIAGACATAGGAEAATGLCGNLGLTKATVREVFGPGLKLSLQPNLGEDTGVCLIAQRRQKFAESYGALAHVIHNHASATG